MEQLFQMLKIINNFKYFEYKTKLLGDTEVDRNNEVLENETSSALLKYLTNFWKSTEMPLINCKMEIKVKWIIYCVSSIQDTKFPSSLCQCKIIKNYQNVILKDQKDQFRGMNIKKKLRIKIQQMNMNIFLDQTLLEFNRLFVLINLNRGKGARFFKTGRYYLPKGIIKICIIINGKNSYDNAIDSGIKRYEEIRKLTKGQDEDYTTRCLLDYKYIQKYYKLIAIDVSRKKELKK